MMRDPIGRLIEVRTLLAEVQAGTRSPDGVADVVHDVQAEFAGSGRIDQERLTVIVMNLRKGARASDDLAWLTGELQKLIGEARERARGQ